MKSSLNPMSGEICMMVALKLRGAAVSPRRCSKFETFATGATFCNGSIARLIARGFWSQTVT